MKKSNEEKLLILKTKLEVYKEVEAKIDEILSGDLDVEDYSSDELYFIIAKLERQIDTLEFKIEDKKIDETPEHSPGDVISYTITDTPMDFVVMEVNHKSKTYKLTSINQVKPVTVIVEWNGL